MQKQRLIALISGIVLALIAVFMVKVYLDQQRQLLEKEKRKELAQIQAGQTAVLVAKQDIPKGTFIDAKMLETAIIPNTYVQPQAATSLDRISGMITVTTISKNEQITLNKLVFPQEVTGGSLAMATPIGKRAITISADNISTLAGMIRPGDYVDVIGMVPVPVQISEGKQATQVAVIPLFQNVLVLAVGQETGVAVPTPESRYKKEERRTEVSSLITLALSPQEANLITFVQEQGKIRLVLRSPADSQIQLVQPTSWDTLFQHLLPKGPVTKPEESEITEEMGYVEIYRGLNKERVLFTK